MAGWQGGKQDVCVVVFNKLFVGSRFEVCFEL